ncbi:MAG TPA: hypothetical protein V6C69_15505 [Trichormus sp.]|jgi:hypothetical protein
MPEPQISAYRWWQIFLPDRGGWFFCYLLFGMLFVRPELLLWDGGSCRHIINGVLMLQTHNIPRDNYTSWANPNIECLTRSWLADFISGAFYQQAHLIGVVFICGAVIALGLTWSYQMGRARGLGLLSGLLVLAVVMATVGVHWSARSHVYSYLPFLVVYYLFFIAPAGWWRVGVGAVTMCLWTNAHGSFAIGMGMIAVKLAGDLYALVRRNPLAAAEFKCDLLAGVAAFLASCINPRGIGLYTAVFGYLTNPNVVHKTDEWRSFDIFAGVGSFGFLVLLALVLALLIKARKVPSLAEAVLFCGLVLGGFESMRLIPYAALIAMPLTGPAWHELRQRVRSQENQASSDAPAAVDGSSAPETDSKSGSPASLKAKSNGLARIVQLEERGEAQEKNGLKMSIACLAIALVMGVVAMSASFFAVKDFDAERLPVDAVNYMQQHHIAEQHGFNYDNWGGYIYFKTGERVDFKTGERVFIDDWGDFLPPGFIDQYLQIILTRPGWEKAFKQWDFRWVLVPNESQLAQMLSQSPDWQVAEKDKTAVLLVRKDGR